MFYMWSCKKYDMITGMVKRVIHNIVKHQMDVHLVCHVTYTDWFIYT